MTTGQGNAFSDDEPRFRWGAEEEAARRLAERYRVTYVDLPEVAIPESIIALIPRHIARSESILPWNEEGALLVVIVSDPSNLELKEKLQFILNREIAFAVAPRSNIAAAIERYYGE